MSYRTIRYWLWPPSSSLPWFILLPRQEDCRCFPRHIQGIRPSAQWHPYPKARRSTSGESIDKFAKQSLLSFFLLTSTLTFVDRLGSPEPSEQTHLHTRYTPGHPRNSPRRLRQPSPEPQLLFQVIYLRCCGMFGYSQAGLLRLELDQVPSFCCDAPPKFPEHL